MPNHNELTMCLFVSVASDHRLLIFSTFLVCFSIIGDDDVVTFYMRRHFSVKLGSFENDGVHTTERTAAKKWLAPLPVPQPTPAAAFTLFLPRSTAAAHKGRRVSSRAAAKRL